VRSVTARATRQRNGSWNGSSKCATRSGAASAGFRRAATAFARSWRITTADPHLRHPGDLRRGAKECISALVLQGLKKPPIARRSARACTPETPLARPWYRAKACARRTTATAGARRGSGMNTFDLPGAHSHARHRAAGTRARAASSARNLLRDVFCRRSPTRCWTNWRTRRRSTWAARAWRSPRIPSW